ncbi:MFS transporter [Parafilimonas sp.]|uniref:MFS transporter n=1 Tax=Parafilimonas sp. TaxID=1969739 RepID=UPI0039E3A4D8
MDFTFPVNNRLYRIAISIFFFIAGLTSASWASRIPDIKTSLQLSEAALGGVLFAVPAGQIAGLPLSGWLISKFGSRQLLIWVSLFFPLTLIMLSLTASVWQLVAVLFFFGFWGNLFNISMNTQAVGIESLYGRSIMASFHGLWSLAGFTGAALGNFFVSGKISPLIHFSVIAALTLLLVSFFYKYTLPDNNRSAQQQPAFFVKPNKHILLLGFIGFCCMICEGCMADWCGIYFHEVINSPIKYITLGYVAFTATMATGRFIGDRLITKFGVEKILQLSGVFIASGFVLIIVFPALQIAVTGCLLVGFGVSCVVPLIYALAGRLKDMSPQFALAAVSTISFLGFLVGPPVIGFIAQASSLRWSFTVVALLGFCTTLLAGRIKKIIGF